MTNIFTFLISFKKMMLFQIFANLFHLFAMVLLLFNMITRRSCAGVSGRTQSLLAIVLLTRDPTLFNQEVDLVDFGWIITFAVCSITTIILIYGPFWSTYDGKHDTFRIELLLIPCSLLALVVNYEFTWHKVLWAFSIYLEAVAIVPQIWLIDKVGCNKYIAVYLLALGTYSALNMTAWIIHYLLEVHADPIQLISSIAQTCFFMVFFFLECKDIKTEDELADISVVDYEKPSPLDINFNDKDKEWRRPDRW